MQPIIYVAVLALAAAASGQEYDDYEPEPRPAPSRVQPGYSGPAAPKPTPVAILKQINRHNEDGSYTYGYEGGDGSFKIETKLPTGEVKGKYGYVDDTGKVRVVEYGATKNGFQPSGEGITVAPPTLVDETTDGQGALLPEFSGAYYGEQQGARAAPRPRPRPQPLDFGPQQFAPSRSPLPARAAVPGAAPVAHEFDFGPAPARQQPRVTYAQPAPRPQFEPQQQPRAQPQQYQPRVTAPVGRPSGGGILDQLSKDYALPAGGAAALHDISFGYY